MPSCDRSTSFGAWFSGADQSLVAALTEFGEDVGVAFQISDDLLDIVSRSEVSGKSPGTDLREHVPTLPVLLLRRAARPEDAELIAALDGDLSDDTTLSGVLERIRDHPVMAEAAEVTRSWGARARESLSGLPASPARDALESLCDAVATRRI